MSIDNKFDVIVGANSEDDFMLYAKITDLGIDPRENELFRDLTTIDDEFFRYLIFAVTSDFTSYKEIKISSFKNPQCLSMRSLGDYPGEIFSLEEFKRSKNTILKAPRMVFLQDGRIYIEENLLNSNFRIGFPRIISHVWEIYMRFGDWNFNGDSKLLN